MGWSFDYSIADVPLTVPPCPLFKPPAYDGRDKRENHVLLHAAAGVVTAGPDGAPGAERLLIVESAPLAAEALEPGGPVVAIVHDPVVPCVACREVNEVAPSWPAASIGARPAPAIKR
jgi:hypothetical protein